MQKRVLIVHPDANMIVEIEDLFDELRKTERYDLSIAHARTRADAEAKAGTEPVHLVVTALEIAPDNKSPVGAGEQRRLGMDLVRTLQAKLPGVRAIIVTGHVDDEVVDFTQSDGMDLAREGGENFRKHLEFAVKRLLGPEPPGGPRRVNLSISLSPKRGDCGYHFQLEGGVAESERELDIQADRLKDLVEDFRDVDVKDAHWRRKLQRLGEDLADALFRDALSNLEFRDALNRWVGKVGLENIRVQFTVHEDLHPIAVEALKQRSDDDCWMLHTAIYRSQEPRGDGPALEPRGLFQDEQTRQGPINFLLIQADVPPNAIIRELDLTLLELPKLAEEVKAIEDLLSKLKREGRPIGEVRVIRAVSVPAGETFGQLVQDTLKSGKWHVVHYAGHTHYDAQNQIGYLFFPHGGLTPMEPIKIDIFAWLLKDADTRFVFLSSCKSAGHDFVYHLAKERVPAIMGFLWEVNDAKAKEFAESFYGFLFRGERRSLEYACLEAKKEMHARYEDDAIWASPVLVMQMSV